MVVCCMYIFQSTGCAYRGRAMIELISKLDEEGVDASPNSQPIDEDRLTAAQVK